MAGLIEDQGAQWIMLSGLAVSLSLILIAVLVNQAATTGYYSSSSSLEFPKGQIRELTAQTRESAKGIELLAWNLNHTNNTTVLHNFTALLDNYSKQVRILYADHGNTVNITLYNYDNLVIPNNDVFIYTPENIVIFNNTNHHIHNIWLNISYDDGATNYSSQPEIIEVIP